MIHPPAQIATVVLAGGQGTRLYPLTAHHCKPAVSYGGRYRLIDIPISNAINSNYRQIFVIAQYLSAELEHHISQTYHFDVFNPGCVDVLTPQENEKGEKQWFAGTADAVRKNLSILLKSPADYFLILSGDQLYNIDFQEMVAFAQKTNADLTIASLFVHKEEAVRMGVLKVDIEGRVNAFYEKPLDSNILEQFNVSKSPKQGSIYQGSMGIYIFKREFLISILSRDCRSDFGLHIIDTAVREGKTYAFLYKGYWEDIGTIESYFKANLLLTQSEQGLNTYDEKNPIYTRPSFLPGPKITSTHITRSIICEGCLIEASEIHNSLIGLRSRIGKSSVIKNTVMMGEYPYMQQTHEGKLIGPEHGIGKNCRIEHAIIDERVQIGDNVTLVNKQKLEQLDLGNGVHIRDGIIIVTAGTKLPDNYSL